MISFPNLHQYGFVSATQGNTHTSTMDLTGTYFTFDDSIKASYNMIVDGNMTSPHKFEMSDDNKKITLTVTSVADKSGDYSDFWVDRVSKGSTREPWRCRVLYFDFSNHVADRLELHSLLLPIAPLNFVSQTQGPIGLSPPSSNLHHYLLRSNLKNCR